MADRRRLGGEAKVSPPASRGPLIAVDGPAGAGKSTVSTLLAARLGVERLDTGAMYRAVTWLALDRGLDPAAPGDAGAVAEVARQARLEIGPEVRIDDHVVTASIRSPEVSAAVSAVAANPEVRRTLVEAQRRWVTERDGGVVEGRDIGSVVLPEADLKIYLVASPAERARRRREEGPTAVRRRDELDANRTVSPMAAASDAKVLDSTDLKADQVVEMVLSWL